MQQSQWFSGEVVHYNKERGTGVIRQYDGAEVTFNIQDVLTQMEQQRKGAGEGAPIDVPVGQMALYRLEQTDIGLLAKEVTFWESRSKAAY
jgi:hypothetical protein